MLPPLFLSLMLSLTLCIHFIFSAFLRLVHICVLLRVLPLTELANHGAVAGLYKLWAAYSTPAIPRITLTLALVIPPFLHICVF